MAGATLSGSLRMSFPTVPLVVCAGLCWLRKIFGLRHRCDDPRWQKCLDAMRYGEWAVRPLPNWGLDLQAKPGPCGKDHRPLECPTPLTAPLIVRLRPFVLDILLPVAPVADCFRETQGAVISIQSVLNSKEGRLALLVDLSKAFERVNPYFALKVLAARGVDMGRAFSVFMFCVQWTLCIGT